MSNTPQTEAHRLADVLDGTLNSKDDWYLTCTIAKIHLQQAAAELRRLDTYNQRLEKKCASYRNLVHSLEHQRSELQKGHVAALEAAQTLESERDANAILTAENDQLREQLALAVAKEREECAEALAMPTAEQVDDINVAESFTSVTKTAAPAQGEPFGYFRAEPFGWTDCPEDDEGAIALYEHPAAPAQEVGLTDDQADAVSMALRRAWQLGQTYWQQADSDYISQHKKSEETQRKFEKLCDAIIAALRAKEQA